MKVKYNDKGALIPSTLIIVTNNTGKPLPRPCNTLPEVIATAMKGYAKHNNLKKPIATSVISSSGEKDEAKISAKNYTKLDEIMVIKNVLNKPYLTISIKALFCFAP